MSTSNQRRTIVDIVMESLHLLTQGLELWFATNIVIVGFNEYAYVVRADGEMLPFSTPA
jgi:hypothetical protein